MCTCVEFGRLGCTCIILSSGADCRFGSSMIQNGGQLIFAHPPTLIGLGLLWSYPVLLGLRVYATTSRRGSDPLSAGGVSSPEVRYVGKVGTFRFMSYPRGFTKALSQSVWVYLQRDEL